MNISLAISLTAATFAVALVCADVLTRETTDPLASPRRCVVLILAALTFVDAFDLALGATSAPAMVNAAAAGAVTCVIVFSPVVAVLADERNLPACS